MAEIAVQRNRKNVRAKLVDVAHAGVERLPYENGAFDKILCVHGVYFWTDLDGALQEIARVLKPRGRAVLVWRTSANRAAEAFPREVYSFWSKSTVEKAITDAGMSAQLVRDVDESEHPLVLVADKGL